MKKKYEGLRTEVIKVEIEHGFLAGSVETVNKDFTVNTGTYEVENDDWYSGRSTFDINFK